MARERERRIKGRKRTKQRGRARREMLVPHCRRQIEIEIDIAKGIAGAFSDERNANSMAGEVLVD